VTKKAVHYLSSGWEKGIEKLKRERGSSMAVFFRLTGAVGRNGIFLPYFGEKGGGEVGNLGGISGVEGRGVVERSEGAGG